MDGYKPLPIPTWKKNGSVDQVRMSRPLDIENAPINPVAANYFFNNVNPKRKLELPMNSHLLPKNNLFKRKTPERQNLLKRKTPDRQNT